MTRDPIKKYYKGCPCMLGGVVARIVGEHESGSWGKINEEDMFSVPLISTPHGTLIKSGVFYLSEMSEDGLLKLKEYEQEIRNTGGELYAGKLTEDEINKH